MTATIDDYTFRRSTPHVYRSDEERLEARRATYRRNSRRQYDLYVRLCRERGIKQQRGKDWVTHLSELRATLPNTQLLRTERDPFKRWWLKRFTLDEIRALAAGMK